MAASDKDPDDAGLPPIDFVPSTNTLTPANIKGALAAYLEHWQTPTLLGSLPPTDPAVLREEGLTRLGQIHYAAIGRVAAAWARFEFSIDGWLAEFAGVEEGVGACLTAQFMGPRARIDSFMALVRHLGASEKWDKPLKVFADREVTPLAEQRNRAVHDVWELDDPLAPHRRETTARRVLRAVRIHVPTRELLDLETKIWGLDTKFHGMAAEIWAELHSSPETSEPDTNR